MHLYFNNIYAYIIYLYLIEKKRVLQYNRAQQMVWEEKLCIIPEK